MEKDQLLKTNFYTIEEWDLTPEGVKNFVVHQNQRIEQLEKELEESKQRQENLEEKVNINSNNSSISPSTEIVKPEKKQKPKKRKRKAKVQGINSNWLFPPFYISSPEQADIWSKKYLPNHQSIFFPRSFYISNQYDMHYRICGDTEYKLRYLKSCGKFIFVDTVICNFELGGVSNQIDSWKNIEVQCRERIDLLVSYSLDPFYVKRCLTVFKFFFKYVLAKLTSQKHYEMFLELTNKARN